MHDKIKKAILILIWIYIIIRAYSVLITHDEAYSFLLIKTNYLKAMAGTANTHWLNSLGMKIGYILFGHEPWQLRIFSMLAWPVYGFSALKISAGLRSRFLGWALFCALILNPFLLDFFSLARGYGLTCAFTLASIWKITEALNKQSVEDRQWQAALVFGMLALFSNYTSLYYFIAIITVFIFFNLLERNWKALWQPKYINWYVITLGAGLFAVANLLFIKLYTGDLEYGGDTDLIGSLFGSMVNGILYFRGSASLANILTYVLVILLSASVVYSFFWYVKHKRVTSFIYLSATLFFILLLNLAFHLLFGTPYLYSRTTLMLYPSIVTVLFLFFDAIEFRKLRITYMHVGLSVSVMLMFIIHFFSTLNFKYCFEWKQQAESKECFDYLVKLNAHNVLTHEWHYGVYLNYYKVLDEEKYSFKPEKVTTREFVSIPDELYNKATHSDYALILPPYDLVKMRSKGLRFTVLKEFPITGSLIIEFTKDTEE